MIKKMVQNILVYVMMTTVLKGLVSNKGFLEIFRFVSGLILILLFVSPVVSLFSSEENWYRRLEENIFEIDYSQMEQEMTVAQGRFEEILSEECQIRIKKQVREIVKEEGLSPENIQVITRKEEGKVLIEEILVEIKEKKWGSSDSIVEDIEITLEKNQKAESRKTDKETKLLKKYICENFELSEEAVKVWKISGETG